MNYIEDGTGKGYKLKINSDNQAAVFSESQPSEGVQSQKGNSFILSARTYLKASNEGGLFYILNNDPSADLEVTRIYTYPHTLTPTNLVMTQIFDPVITGGEDVSSTAIINKNRGNSKVFDLTIKISSSSTAMTYTGGTTYHEPPLVSRTQNSRNMNGTNILPSGKSILFGFYTEDGSNATDAETIYFSVNIIKRKV